MLNKNLSAFAILSENFALKGSCAEKFLLNIENGEKYDLDSDQYELLLMCDGRKKLSEIIEGYDPESKKIVFELLDNLSEIGAILFTIKEGARKFIEVTKTPQLQSIHFELTGLCNMKCLHCYQESYLGKSTDLTLDEIQNLIRQMQLLNVEKIGLSGGEPLMRTDLFEITNFLKEKEIVVSSILTNGLALNNELIEKVHQCLGKNALFVSLDGVQANAMKLRGFKPQQYAAVFEKIIGNIMKAVKMKLPIMINTVVTRDNVDSLLHMYGWLRSLGVIGWRIALPKFAGSYLKNKEQFSLSRKRIFEEYLKIIRCHLSTKKRGGTEFHLQIEHFYNQEVFENLEPLADSSFACDYEGKKQSCCIKPNGDVTPCPLYLDLVIGNIRTQSLESIWYSEKMQRIKNIQACDVRGCKTCSRKIICASGCRANAIFLHNSIEAPDSDACEATEFFVNQVLPVLRTEGIELPKFMEEI